MENLIRNRIIRAIREHIFPGCVVGFIHRGQKSLLPFGNFTYNTNSLPVTEDTIFDVASITKSVPTSSLALKLIDEGKLSPESQLIDFIPELKGNYKDQILIKHLLNHTLEFELERLSIYKFSTKEILKTIFRANLKKPPGESFSYVNPTSILLGLVVESISDQPLDKLADEIFFKSLAMTRTTFWPLKIFDKEQIVPTENDGFINKTGEWRGKDIQGEVHDESARVFMKSGKTVGSAGLFSTAPDLLNFLEMLLNDGELNGKRYFSPKIIKAMHTNQIGDLGYQGLGWELYQPRYMGEYATRETFGKTGFTGCVVICDTKKGVGMVMLSNTTYPKRKPLPEHISTINAVRRDIADIVFGSI